MILDISSIKYVNNINEDIFSFIKLNIDKNKNSENFQNNYVDKKVVSQLVDKSQGNFLYTKFVMDSVLEGKTRFSIDEIGSMPSGLFGMYNLFFDRMVTQYGEDSSDAYYIKILQILLVSFEGLDANQISFFTGIEDNIFKKFL